MTNTYYLTRYKRQRRIDPERLKSAVPIGRYASVNRVSVAGARYWLHKDIIQGFKCGGRWWIYMDENQSLSEPKRLL